MSGIRLPRICLLLLLSFTTWLGLGPVAGAQTPPRPPARDTKPTQIGWEAGELIRLFRTSPAATAKKQIEGIQGQVSQNRDVKAEQDRRRVGGLRDVDKAATLPKGDYELPADWKEKRWQQNRA